MFEGFTVETLKSAGRYADAGKLAASQNGTRHYGCHYGMRSELDRARAEFYRAYDAELTGNAEPDK